MLATRWPTATSVTPAPISSTKPHPSDNGTTGSEPPRALDPDLIIDRSRWFSDAALIRTTTSPGPAVGRSRSTTFRFSRPKPSVSSRLRTGSFHLRQGPGFGGADRPPRLSSVRRASEGGGEEPFRRVGFAAGAQRERRVGPPLRQRLRRIGEVED